MLRKAYLPIVFAVLVAVLLQPAAAFATSSAGNGAVASGSSTEALDSATSGKWIDVNLSRQRLTAYVGKKAVFSSLVSTGTAAHPTPTGTYRILDKIRSRAMSGPGYYLPNVPYVMHFRGGGFAIHGTYWHHNFGRRMSHGCINLPTSVAARVYSWAPVGTRVVIHY